ncbi:transposase domain-containing protein [Tropicimonas sp. S265A]|uniref:transposase domain-containing protein n=1 Tax=Tropicimonas sp. S265A TaxID=3415134 RepID=UPI003C7C4732
MRAASPSKMWWSVADLEKKNLPGLPSSRRRIGQYAVSNGWQDHPKLARRRRGQGGGWEYHWSLLPVAAQRKLISEEDVRPNPALAERGDAWAAFEALPEKTKAKARDRLEIINRVMLFEAGGIPRTHAVQEAANISGCSARAIWNWFELIEGIAHEDRLAHLAPRHRTSPRKVAKAGCDQAFWDLLKSNFLRLGEPTFRKCYDDACEVAVSKGWQVLHYRTALRRMDCEVPQVVQVFARQGEAGLARKFPPQIRDKTSMVAMEGVNADCHKIDVFVEWPDGTVNRPQIVAFQDLYSGKILSWRVDHAPNKVAVMAAFGEMIERYGIPRHCTFDNGREFANKWLTGGAPTRFRFKVRDDEPLGILTLLGIEVHWARPGHGQAKPIERAFGDIAQRISKDARFQGAYVGHKPDAKPENYGSRAVPSGEFLRVLAEGIEKHNARAGRLTETANGRSFDETFATSYANAPVRKATEEQRRLWLMGQEVRKLHATHGTVTLFKNGYWSDWMSECAGQEVVLRFDPDHLQEGLYVYDKDGAYLGFAACREKVGFYDLTGAREAARLERKRKRAVRELEKLHRPMSVDQVAAHLDAASRPTSAPEALEAKVVAPDFRSGPRRPQVSSPAYEPEQTDEERAAREDFVAQFPTKTAAPVEEDPRALFKRMLALEQAAEAGERLGEVEARKLRGYQQTAEYSAFKKLFEQFGEEALG